MLKYPFRICQFSIKIIKYINWMKHHKETNKNFGTKMVFLRLNFFYRIASWPFCSLSYNIFIWRLRYNQNFSAPALRVTLVGLCFLGQALVRECTTKFIWPLSNFVFCEWFSRSGYKNFEKSWLYNIEKPNLILFLLYIINDCLPST
jgi:hypothetical protein